MDLLSDKKLLIYLRCYSSFLVLASFCVIVSILVQEPHRIISILEWSITGICGVILFVLLFIKKNRSLHEQYIFVIAAISVSVLLTAGIIAGNQDNIGLFTSLLISFSVCLYSIYSGKIPGRRLINLCRIITAVIAVALTVYAAWNVIYFCGEFQRVNMVYGERTRLIAILVLSCCVYVFNILFFPMNLYKRMLSRLQSDMTVN